MSLTLYPGGEPLVPFPIISQGSITSGIEKIPKALLGASLAPELWRVGGSPWLSLEVAAWWGGLWDAEQGHWVG